MLEFLVRYVHRAGDALERLKGSRIYKHHFLPGKSHYSVLTTDGFRFKIHCEDVLFICEYRNKLWSSRRSLAFRVHCEFQKDVPKEYREKLKDVKFLPCLGSIWTSKEFRRKTAIKIYLDTMLVL